MPIWQLCLLGLKGRGLRHAEGPRVSTETLPPPSGDEGTLPLTPGPPPPTPADPAPGPDPRLRAPPPGPASGLHHPSPRTLATLAVDSGPARTPRRSGLILPAQDLTLGSWLGPARCGAASDLDRGLTSTRRGPRAPPPAPGPCRAAYQGGAALLSRPPCGSSLHQTGRTAAAGRAGRTGRGRRAGRSAACREV